MAQQIGRGCVSLLLMVMNFIAIVGLVFFNESMLAAYIVGSIVLVDVFVTTIMLVAFVRSGGVSHLTAIAVTLAWVAVVFIWVPLLGISRDLINPQAMRWFTVVVLLIGGLAELLVIVRTGRNAYRVASTWSSTAGARVVTTPSP